MKRKTDILLSAITIILSLLTSISCRKVVIDSKEKEKFLTFTEMGFYPEGEPRFTYDENNHQKCINQTRGTFRIQTNTQDTCLHVALDSDPYEGEMVMSELDYSDSEIRISDQFEFECSKKTDGKMWLWDGYTKTGLIVSDY